MDTDCVEWTGHRDRQGYGQTYFGGRSWRAHRLAWTEANGPIPSGMFICHHCDNPPCINVDHLFLGTNVENSADRDAKGRNKPRIGEKNQAKITREQAEAIRSDERRRGLVAAEYGLHPGTIWKIRAGVIWH